MGGDSRPRLRLDTAKPQPKPGYCQPWSSDGPADGQRWGSDDPGGVLTGMRFDAAEALWRRGCGPLTRVVVGVRLKTPFQASNPF